MALVQAIGPSLPTHLIGASSYPLHLFRISVSLFCFFFLVQPRTSNPARNIVEPEIPSSIPSPLPHSPFHPERIH
ncbi:hypothetical protein SCHPADRAFT_620585 [Schizopora paradoxa]|uniref:Uncharacterized protein n=1 Tax=Schizopora paradoxa TaxID=27342 RepID=A0A0H2R8E2_9AGAM|nr:hypothetical protein SCHPADRAFT_620585 [Schizopora paradoxa]